MTVPPLPDAQAEFDVTVNGYLTRLQLSYLDATIRGAYTSPPVTPLWGESFPRAGVHQASAHDDYLKTLEAATLVAYTAAIAAAIAALKTTPAETPLDYSNLDTAVAALQAAVIALNAAVQPA
jgi:hypothetical protein